MESSFKILQSILCKKWVKQQDLTNYLVWKLLNLTEYLVWNRESSNKISHSILCERQKSSYKSHIVICVTKWSQAVISQSILCEKGSQAAKSHNVSCVRKRSQTEDIKEYFEWKNIVKLKYFMVLHTWGKLQVLTKYLS